MEKSVSIGIVDVEWRTEGMKKVSQVEGSYRTLNADLVIYAIGYDGFHSKFFEI